MRARRSRAGFTLLELILSLSLSSLILGAVAMAIHLQMHSLDKRREIVEEAQLARAVLELVAKDVRSCIQQIKFDDSGMKQLEEAAAALSALTGGGTSGGGTTPGSGGAGGGGTGAGGGGGGGAGGGGTGGGAGGGGAGGGATGGGAGGGGTGGGATGGAAGETGDPTEEASNTENIAQGGTPPQQPGLYGNQNELMIDVARLPRVDEYQFQRQGIGQVQDVPSDIKNVTYFLRPDDGSGNGGLVRRYVDRNVAIFSAGSVAGTTQNDLTDKLVAPEVVSIQFQYFDGTELLPEWDSTVNKGLPVAVQITIQIRSNQAVLDPNDPNSGILTFQKMVRLPVATPAATKEEEDTEGMENVGI